MKGDFSRDSFRREKHFHDVRMQQGRVLLDSDWNEQVAISAYRTETGTGDIVGQSGAPLKNNSGFELLPAGSPAGTDITISAGHFYVDGILCEQEATALFAAQPDYNATPLPAAAGKYIFYLDVWQRHMTLLEDAALREVALGLNGPDTTTRNKTVWQVKAISDAAAKCSGNLPDSIIKPPNGTLKAKVSASTGAANPCGLVSSGGYRRLENQLYRVEVHLGAELRKDATFKWSRDNGSVQVKWAGVDTVNPAKLIAGTTGRDELLGFKSGDWIELVDDKTDLLSQPGILVQLLTVDGTSLTVNTAGAIFPPGVASINYATYKNPRIRRWDSVGPLKMNTGVTDTPANWIELEEGILVQFTGEQFHSGDYWLIPARTATANIEWPMIGNVPQAIAPHGVRHHFAKLAVMERSAAGIWTRISDCRPLFPALTELTALQYVGGDGQEARPGIELPNMLQAGVANGKWPVANARVKFEVLQGGGSLIPAAGIITTGADGLANCRWLLGTTGLQQVKATLIDDGNNVIGLPLIFDAKLTPPALFYVSGDGQEAAAGQNLPNPLKVGIAYEQFPVAGARVKFEVISGGGVVNPANASSGVLTAADGIALCNWKLGTSGNQQVKATLLDTNNNPVHLPVIFTAIIEQPGVGGKDCCITVGKGGQYNTVNEVFEDSSLKGQTHICICLLPGETHSIKALNDDSRKSIKISGCNADVTLHEPIQLLADNIIFEQFNLICPENLQAQILLVANEVDITNCSFTKIENDTNIPFIQIEVLPARIIEDNRERTETRILLLQQVRKTCIARLQNNIIRADQSLALGAGVSGWIVNNIITGNVLLQYLKDGFENLQWSMSQTAKPSFEKETLSKLSIVQNASDLRICGNNLATVVTNNANHVKIPSQLQQGVSANIPGYRSLIITDNIFHRIGSAFVGLQVSMHRNHFANPTEREVVAFVLGTRGIITENIGTVIGDNGGIIDTLFQQKIRNENFIMVT